MNQQYHWNTLYPVNKNIPPLTVKLIFDEHTHAVASGRRAAAASDSDHHYLDSTQGEPGFFALDDLIVQC